MLASIIQETSGGAYYYIEQGSDSNVASAFGQAMGGVLSIVAQSAVLSISPPPFAKEKSIEIVQVHHDDVIDRGGGVYTVNIGDFYADETRDVIFEVGLADKADWDCETPILHARISLSYFDAIRNTNCTVNGLQCCIARPADSTLSPVNKHVEEQWLRVQMVQDIRLAKQEADSNQFSAARSRLQNTMLSIETNRHVDAFYSKMMAGEVKELRRSLDSEFAYRDGGGHRMTNAAMSHTAQRSMASGPMPSWDAGLISPAQMQKRMYTTKKRAMFSNDYEAQSKNLCKKT
jgi:hypothetical protein